MAFELLLVEDSPLDVELVKEALDSWGKVVRLNVVSDGDQAIRFLRRESPFTNASRPNLVILDLNLPKRSGVEVLEEMKKDGKTSSIPVVVLTTSDRDADVSRAYALHANCYLTKPLEVNDFLERLKAIENFWLNHVRLPRQA